MVWHSGARNADVRLGLVVHLCSTAQGEAARGPCLMTDESLPCLLPSAVVLGAVDGWRHSPLRSTESIQATCASRHHHPLSYVP